jgi:hypothetical protein
MSYILATNKTRSYLVVGALGIKRVERMARVRFIVIREFDTFRRLNLDTNVSMYETFPH